MLSRVSILVLDGSSHSMGGYLGSFEFENRSFEDSSIFPKFLHPVFEFVASNGWILLFGAIILFLLWKWISPTLRSMYNSWVETKEEPIGTWTTFSSPSQEKYGQAARRVYHHNSFFKADQDIAMSRQAAMFASRERLQNLVQRDSTLAQERSSEKEKEKRDRKVEEWEKHRMFGGGINDKSTKSQNNDDGGPSDGSEGTRRRRPFQSDGYNPLMGHGGGGGGYRRTRDVCRGG